MSFSRILIILLLLIGLAGAYLPDAAWAKGIRWQTFSAGMARGKSENKTVFVHFYAKWCGPCKIMDKKTFKDPGVIAALNQDFIPIKIDVDRNQKVSKLFKVKAIPDTWLIGTDYEIIHHRSGYISPKQLKALLKIYSED